MKESHYCFSEMKRKLFAELGDHAVGALATCYDNQPFVRSISCVFLDGKIYFQTDRKMKKGFHIQENPCVSVCFRHIQIRGICKEMEHPLNPKSARFYELFSECFPEASHKYSSIENERVYQIEPSEVEVWRYSAGASYIERFDMNSKQYQIARYDAVEI